MHQPPTWVLFCRNIHKNIRIGSRWLWGGGGGVPPGCANAESIGSPAKWTSVQQNKVGFFDKNLKLLKSCSIINLRFKFESLKSSSSVAFP